MSVLWRWFTAFLVWLSSDPRAVESEAPKAAAACAVAYAALLGDASPPAPAPAPPNPAKCCQDCAGTGVIRHGDGHTTPCPCPPQCKCKAGKANCRGGCAPAASPATAKPASL